MDAEIRIGCSSWTSESWWGRVYPRGISDGDRLSYYARLFDTVEVDSTYYRSPARGMVSSWRRRTPDGFVFTLKFPRDLLDPKEPVDAPAIREFTDSAKLLGPKLGPVLLQFPPWVKPGRATTFLSSVLAELDTDLRYAVELRDAGWYEGETWARLEQELSSRRVALAWSYLTYLEIPPARTADFVYLRFIGDHDSIPEERHGELRADRSRETDKWATRLRDQLAQTRAAYVFFNNHYAGFAPASANEFRADLGLPPIDVGRYARSARRLDDESIAGPDQGAS
jgi:uncharacterized protein YecE (DUF72 family)